MNVILLHAFLFVLLCYVLLFILVYYISVIHSKLLNIKKFVFNAKACKVISIRSLMFDRLFSHEMDIIVV